MKRKAGDEIANWLSCKKTRTVLGIDANSPKVDHPDRAGVNMGYADLYASDSQELLGPELSHNLKDVYRNYLETHPDEMLQIKQKYKDGPPAISHYTYKKDKTHVPPARIPIPHRYDHIYATPDFMVSHAEYYPMDSRMYDGSNKKLSDHAMVVANLSIC